jgi:hypothetical protein
MCGVCTLFAEGRLLAGDMSDGVLNWVASYFETYWAKEVAIGFNNNPISIYVAAQNGTIVGFSAYNARQKDSSVPWE